jgi:hypothetical protein
MSVEHDFSDEQPPAGTGGAADHTAEDVAASRSDSRWSVAAADWQDLPPEVGELLAATVVVRAEGVPDEERDEGPDHPPPGEPRAVRQRYGECLPRFVAPVPLPRVAPDPVGLAPAAPATSLPAGGPPRSRRTRRRI